MVSHSASGEVDLTETDYSISGLPTLGFAGVCGAAAAAAAAAIPTLPALGVLALALASLVLARRRRPHSGDR